MGEINVSRRSASVNPSSASSAARRATRQLTFDHTIDKTLLIEAVQDRARRRYGTDIIKPAALG